MQTVARTPVSLPVEPLEAANGQRYRIRPIRPEDELAVARFHATLSPESVYLRYSHAVSAAHLVTHERLQRVCADQGGAQTALVAVCYAGPRDGDIVGVGRLCRLPGGRAAEFALVVSDEWQGRGLGSELLRGLIETARTIRMEEMIGYVRRGNRPMLGVCRKLNFRVSWDMEQDTLRAEATLA